MNDAHSGPRSADTLQLRIIGKSPAPGSLSQAFHQAASPGRNTRPSRKHVAHASHLASAAVLPRTQTPSRKAVR